MSASPKTYFIKRAAAEEGPLSVAQVNRMKQKREIAADTPCRAANESEFRRLDVVLPHLRDQQPVDPAKIANLKKAMADDEARMLTKTAFGSSALFWVPFGGVASLTAVTCGIILLFRHRQPVGLLAMFLGAVGLFSRIWLSHLRNNL